MGSACCGERLETRERRNMRQERQQQQREIEEIKLQQQQQQQTVKQRESEKDRVSFADQVDENEAWSRVTPVGQQFDTSDTDLAKQHSLNYDRSQTDINNNHKRSILKHEYLSEGEQSSDDCDVDVLSSGKRSNYTNTSIHKMDKNSRIDDVSSQNSGQSGFSYLNQKAHPSKKSLRSMTNNSLSSGRKMVSLTSVQNMNTIGNQSELSSQGGVKRVDSGQSASDDMASLGYGQEEMAGLDDNNDQSGLFNKSDAYDSDDGNREIAYMPRQNAQGILSSDDDNLQQALPQTMRMNTIIEEEDENIRRTMGDSTPNHYK